MILGCSIFLSSELVAFIIVVRRQEPPNQDLSTFSAHPSSPAPLDPSLYLVDDNFSWHSAFQVRTYDTEFEIEVRKLEMDPGESSTARNLSRDYSVDSAASYEGPASNPGTAENLSPLHCLVCEQLRSKIEPI